MPVYISDDELKVFNDNGISTEQIQDTVNLYRKDGLKDDEIRTKVDAKLQSFQAQPTTDNSNNEQESVMPKDGVITGGVSQNVKTYLDKNGRVHYENEDDNKMNWFQRLKRNIKAGYTNADSFFNETNPKSDVVNAKRALAVGAVTLPYGAGAKITQWGASKLAPFFGKKIAQGIASGIGGGVVGGAADGTLRGIVEENNKQNPLLMGVQEGVLGGIAGGALGGIGGQIMKGIKARQLRKMTAKSRAEKKELRKKAKEYYKDYIQQTNVNRQDLGKIYLGDEGMQETLNHHVKNSQNFPDLKTNIKNADYIREELPQHARKDDIIKFHRLRKNGEDYLIGETSKGKKYYLSKNTTPEDLTANTEDTSKVVSDSLPPSYQNQNLVSEINPTNIIIDNADNFNPNANIKLGDDIPENLKKTLPTHREQLEKALGLTEENWDKEPNFYSKEKEDEAYAILSHATGKSVKWLKSQLKTGKNGKGTAKRREFIELLLEYTDDKLDGYPSGKYYFTNDLSYEAKGSNSDQVGKGQELAERVYDDAINGNFDFDPREPIEKAIDTADIEYKKIMRELIDSNGAEGCYEKAIKDFNEAIKGLPEETQGEYISDFLDDLDKVENIFKSEKMRESGDLKKSQLAQNADLPKEIENGVKQYPPEYEVLHNKDLIKNAQKEIENNPSSRLARLDDMITKNKPMSAQDMEEARQLLGIMYQEGRIDEALALTEKMSIAGSKAGQTVQAMSLWAKTTPEGAVRQAQKIINDYNETAKKKIPNLTEEQAQGIIDLTQKIQAAPTGREKDILTGELLKSFTDLIPQSGGNKLKTLRNISLLLNGKTFARNIVGNAIFSAMENGVTKPIAAGLDKIASIFTHQRTRSLPQMKEYGQGLLQGVKEGVEDVNMGIDTRNLGGRFDLPQGRSFENTPVLGALEKALDFSLRVPDRAFYQATFNESLANQMKAARVDTPTAEMVEMATQEALESVYQNNGKISSMISGLRKGLNKVGVKDFGLGDTLIPYAQTPANVAQQGINYSPLGAINAVNSFLEGNQRQATLDGARAIAGSGIIGGGYLGAKNGLFTDNVDDYKTRKNYEALGIRPNQMILPTGSVMSYSQLQPLAAPLATGDILNSIQGGNYMQAMDKGLGTLADLSMLRGITSFTKDYNEDGLASAISNTITSLPSQLIGTGINQINTYIDPYQRETYSPNPIMQGLNQARAKAPLISKTLPKKYDVTGKEIVKYEGEKGIGKAYNNFVNPVFINKPKDDIVMQEVMALYEVTGEKGSLLNVPEKKIKLDDGTTKQLSGKEFSRYSQRLGETTYNGYKELMNTQRYLNADDNTRLKLLGDIKQNAKGIVQEELFGKINKHNRQNKISKKIENKLNKGQNKINRMFSKMDNQLVDDIMYKE